MIRLAPSNAPIVILQAVEKPALLADTKNAMQIEAIKPVAAPTSGP